MDANLSTIIVYNHEAVIAADKKICEEIKTKLKEVQSNLKRYKLFVQCIVGEKKGQGVKMGTKCLWDTTTDSFVSAQFENEVIYATVIAFGVYYY